MSQLPIVAVTPALKTPRWGSVADTVRVSAMETGDLATILQAEYDTDAYVVPYRAIGESHRVPLKGAALNTFKVEVDAVFFDLDRPNHEPWDGPESARDAAAALAARLPDAAVYGSRGGLRVVLLPERPIDAKVYRYVAKALAPRILAAIHEAGLEGQVELDTGSLEWSRHYRAPHCIREDDGTDVSPYAGLVVPSPWLPTPTVELPPSFDDAIVVVAGDAPDEVVVSDEEWDALEENLGPYFKQRSWPTLLGTLRKGERFYKPGERNKTTFKALYLFAEAVLSVADEPAEAQDLYRVFYGSTAASTGTSPDEALKELWQQAARIAAAVAEKRQTEKFREEEAEAADQEVQSAGLPLMVFNNNAYFVLDATASPLVYRPPVTNTAALPGLLKRYCSGLVDVCGAKGGYKTTASLLDEYAQQVGRVVYAMGSRGAKYEPDTATLVQGILPNAPVEPVYHADIAAWLEAITGPDDHDAVLDWLATVRNVALPTCALYFQGAPGIGKQVFALGVGSLWGVGAVDFDLAIEEKNGVLMDSPAIFLDEKTSRRGASAKFRSLVANREHSVRALYQPTALVRGCYRIIIGANNANAISMADAETREDLEAIVERVRHIQVPAASGGYLKRIGGEAVTHSWVRYPDGRPGKFAEHTVWLEKNRTVVPGERYLVAGRRTDWHEDILATTDSRADALSVIAKAISMSGLGAGSCIEKCPDVVDGLHAVWVLPSELRKQWFRLSSDPITPSARTIAAALRAVRLREARHAQGVRFAIPAKAILAAAHAVAIGDTDKIRTLLTPAAP